MLNNQMFEWWSPWTTPGSPDRQPLNMLYDWVQCGFKEFGHWNTIHGRLWGFGSTQRNKMDGWFQAWESIFRLQQLSLQWLRWLPRNVAEKDLERRVVAIEERILGQTRSIAYLRQHLPAPGSEAEDTVQRLKDLVERQGHQFEELTETFNKYLKQTAKFSIVN